MSKIYAYCITEKINGATVNVDTDTMSGDGHVQVLTYDDIQAVIDFVDENEFNDFSLHKNIGDMEWVAEKAFIHENVIEEIMKQNPVLPLQFCSIFNTEDNAMKFLSTHYKSIKENIEVAVQHNEWGIKMFFDKQVSRERVLEIESYKDEQVEIAAKPKGLAFMLQKKFERKIENYIETEVNENIQVLYGRIKEMSQGLVIKDVIPSDDESRRMVLNIVTLVKKVDAQSLLKEIDELNDLYGWKGYSMKISGPWPIYSFVKMSEGE